VILSKNKYLLSLVWLIPLAITLILIGLFYSIANVTDSALVIPAITAASVFYWRLFAPEMMNLAQIFLLGLIEDSVSNSPLGMHAALYIVMAHFIQRYDAWFSKAKFSFIWLAFAMLLCFVSLMNWLAMVALSGTLLPASDLIYQTVIATLFYPAAHALFNYVKEIVAP
jgi:rod shape-determining protein MreD